MKLIVIDTETTGFSHEDDVILEAAMAVYDVSTKTILFSIGYFTQNEPVENPALEHNGITPEMIAAGTEIIDDDKVLDGLFGTVSSLLGSGKAAAIVAHNAPFDRGMLAAHDERWDSFRWVDSQRDINYPRARMSRSLDHLCVDHGINPHSPMRHRAAYDVMLTCHLLEQVPDLAQQVEDLGKPRGTFKALVPRERKDEAKSRGFEWKPKIRSWVKDFPLDVDINPTDDRPFALRRVK